MNLQEFLEPIKLAGIPRSNHEAYFMDGRSPQPSMKNSIGLGECSCGDYFIANNNDTVVLIEETRLIGMFRGLRREYSYLNDDDQYSFIKKTMQQENKLKAYGSMLVLCRLSSLCKDAKAMLDSKKYQFWLVVSDIEEMNKEPDTSRVFDFLRDHLSNDLRSDLSPQIVEEVRFLSSSDFIKKLSEYTTSS